MRNESEGGGDEGGDGVVDNEMSELVKATAKLYRDALVKAGQMLRLNWWGTLLPLLYYGVIFLGSTLFLPLGVVGRFLLGLLVAFLIAHYLALVSASVAGERTSLSQLWLRARDLFSPTIGVLFTLYILSLVAEMAFRNESQRWLLVALNFVIVFLFNPLPEVIYQSRQNALAVFTESFQFVKENTIEWFLPIIIMILPLILANPKQFFLQFATSGPLEFPQLIFGQGIALAGNSLSAVLIIPALLAASFYLMIFRGLLYARLSTSSRRKRVFESKFN